MGDFLVAWFLLLIPPPRRYLSICFFLTHLLFPSPFGPFPALSFFRLFEAPPPPSSASWFFPLRFFCLEVFFCRLSFPILDHPSSPPVMATSFFFPTRYRESASASALVVAVLLLVGSFGCQGPSPLIAAIALFSLFHLLVE